MSKKSAYPIVCEGKTLEAGLTKRELFAAMAMQGLLSDGNRPRLDIVDLAVGYADRLIIALNEPTSEETKRV